MRFESLQEDNIVIEFICGQRIEQTQGLTKQITKLSAAKLFR